MSEEVRDLARQLASSGKGIRILQVTITAIDAPSSTCTVLIQGGGSPISGMRWLLDAYTPQVGDVAWMLDGGPASRFLLGATNR